MDWYDRKTRQMVFRAVWLTLLLAGTYLLYSYYKTRNLSDYQMQNSYTGLKPAVPPVKPPENRTFTIRQPDSTQEMRKPDSQALVYASVKSSSEPSLSSTTVKAALTDKSKKDSLVVKPAKITNILQGPSATFSRDYTVGVGKTTPVTISWADGDSAPANFKLLTIKVDDITDYKARFTIEDPFNVLLFSQTGYSVNDKIIIRDAKHDIDISVLKVNANSVVVKLVSHLNEAIVSKLQRAE